MEKPFFNRLKEYYADVGKVLRGEADGSRIFPNSTDKGMNRELIYLNFLEQHAPKGCDIFPGGFLFNKKGEESKQIDIIVTSDSTPQFKFLNKDGIGKSFACIEGTIAIISVKSNLDSNELKDALQNFASIPDKEPLNEKCVNIHIGDYEEWPLKIIFAYNGAHYRTLTKTMDDFYQQNPDIPMNKRPNFIHVAGNGSIIRISSAEIIKPDGTKTPFVQTTRSGEILEPNTYYVQPDSTDAWALAFVQQKIQQNAMVSRYILYGYFDLLDKF